MAFFDKINRLVGCLQTTKRRLRTLRVLLVAVTASACAVNPPPPEVHKVDFTPVPFTALPGWSTDQIGQAMPAFVQSCEKLALSPPDEALGGTDLAATLGGRAGNWTSVCSAARALPPGDEAAARAFVESSLQPYAVSQEGKTEGLYTGYYEPQAPGARTRGGAYQTAIYGRPTDLISVDLGAFAPDLKSRSISGRLSNGSLIPYYDRAEIERGALTGKRAELLYLAEPVDAFFLQIQGSGRIILPNGGIVRVTYAGQNGRPYVPIGRVLAANGEIPLAEVSMQSIRNWLTTHPDQAAAIMDQNPSFVFFRELPNTPPNQGPPGALGVPLTPGRSIAVDRSFVPLGAPVWIATTDPLDNTPLQRLVVAQDLGGAIRGAARADLFFGWDAQAAERAGKMRQPGEEFVLLPKP